MVVSQSCLIPGVLCDGNHFYFFQFVGRFLGSKLPQFSLGRFPDGSQRINIETPDPMFDSEPDYRAQVCKLRYARDGLYYIFLKAYQCGLEGHWDQSVQNAKVEGKERVSTPGWLKARAGAEEALKLAILAWDQYKNGELGKSKKSAEAPVQSLNERYEFYFYF
jgi:hypothetical protein